MATAAPQQLTDSSTACTPRRPAARRSCCAAPLLDDRVPPPRRPGACRIASLAERPLVDPNVTHPPLGERRLATAVLLPHATTTARRCRCCSIRTAARTPSTCVHVAQRLPHVAVVRRPGLRRRRPDGRGTPGAVPTGSGRCTSTWPPPVLDDQVDALHAAADCTPLDLDACGDPRLELRRLPRRAGGAAPPRRVPRRRSPARRSPTGGCTTPTTPSATSATRPSTPRLRPDQPAATGRPAHPPAAADPRPGRRQRRGRPHPAAVVGAARRGQAARGAPAGRASPT